MTINANLYEFNMLSLEYFCWETHIILFFYRKPSHPQVLFLGFLINKFTKYINKLLSKKY